MKIMFKALCLAACIIVSAVNGESLRGAQQLQMNIDTTDNVRQLQINFAGGNELASPLRIGEEVLLEVNDKLDEKVSGKKLLAIAENVQNNNVLPENERLAQALKDVIQKLYPSETVQSILSHVIPALQSKASTETRSRQLEINFSNGNELASPLRIGEEILTQVNNELIHKVSSKTLLVISKRVQQNDLSVSSDPETATIVKILNQVIHKLYPNESINTILSHVIPALEEKANTEM